MTWRGPASSSVLRFYRGEMAGLGEGRREGTGMHCCQDAKGPFHYTGRLEGGRDVGSNCGPSS